MGLANQPKAMLRRFITTKRNYHYSETSKAIKMEATEIRSHQQYHSNGLNEADLSNENPVEIFQKWFDEAQRSGKVKEPEAMCLSTSNIQTNRISSRFVLLKKIEPSKGFTFYSNYQSRKAQELDGNPECSLTFYWAELHQQIRISGRSEKISVQESEVYFDSRPIGSRIGAWSSPQSSCIKDRKELLDLVSMNEDKFGIESGSIDRETPSDSDLNAKIPIPPFWGGYRVVPHEIEFWVGRPNRLHDRFVFRRDLDTGTLLPTTQWIRERLAP
ncbi:hypothetical protein MJO29_012298 [Puccinia striiformis f. sp. tritici]|nr:hypothetical protein MJO29_012298 [Puccinia striiformis f. sp. tritici]